MKKGGGRKRRTHKEKKTTLLNDGTAKRKHKPARPNKPSRQPPNKKKAVGRYDPRARGTPAARYPSCLLTNQCWSVRCSLSGLTRCTPPRRCGRARPPPAPPTRAKALSRLGIVAVSPKRHERARTQGPPLQAAARPRLSYSAGATPAIVKSVFIEGIWMCGLGGGSRRGGGWECDFRFFVSSRQNTRSTAADRFLVYTSTAVAGGTRASHVWGG